MKIGILQTGHVVSELKDAFGDYAGMFQNLLSDHGLEFRTWNVVDGIFPGGIADCDGWLITGSRHGVYESHAWISPLCDFIRSCYRENIPMIGVCFGHQVIAYALGGKVELFSGGWNIGRTPYWFGSSLLHLNCWHQDQVIDLPPDAEVLAESPTCRYAALRYGRNAMSVQAHPEFDDIFIKALMRTRGKGVVPDDLLEIADRQMGKDLDSDRISEMFGGFLFEGKVDLHHAGLQTSTPAE